MAQENKLQVGPSPHVRAELGTSRMMLDVIIALIPVTVAAAVLFRWETLRVPLLCVATCIITELIFNLCQKKPNSLNDFSAVITGLILAFSVPPTLPSFACVIGSVVAVGIGKMIFGGLGSNIFNPAMVGRAFLMICFGQMMTTWNAPAVNNAAGIYATTKATPLAAAKFIESDEKKALQEVSKAEYEKSLEVRSGQQAVINDLFLGRVGGSLGETSGLAILIGGVYLLLRKTISYQIPLGMIGSILIIAGVGYYISPQNVMHPLGQLLAGGAMFGAFFIATDPVSSPLSSKGRWMFGIGLGTLVMVIRIFSGYPEGVMFAVLIMNAVAPLLDRWTVAKPLGAKTK
ncbi:MAG: RnfABCDGE type electron transport complex subunit D [Actinobacteria bacterium]|nr:RnfABCDGE type electron transport complex subunit D [Actinomycetota bacterium]